ncbi:ABC transporter substrate-binding protein [Sinorhizobium medicae]|uniref:ABC transporter substrate-binding protein n=1 Tax=Sinorhizobium medicae TaxID=110321 RepID=UPI0004624C33|nr:ABC transporter substrate-binding protein [Sinorhizobium medicae]MDX0430370.1 ABC transporter substrate-binding protein [Sinorhizobium medicae]MDX0443573.1 ABC transporter substrate-binding protein [Sinorhizobium medicae]MDX0534887.1 ABC transporter substrate-binding protein [Sinorhizobium medicae]MDX0573349.1 ABC transporter substrate-binding protein [Sinorhizobium medicae]MDX0602503.1 ABC transporter substrate-binding protein [Sinorhizobium medicae]
MKKLLAPLLLAAGICLMAGSSGADECGNVTIAEMDWASAGVAARVDRLILENGYGCSVKLVPGDTMPTFSSMNDKAEPDLVPELWINSVRTPFDAAVKEGRLVEGARVLSEGGVEGWWIPKFIADAHPTIRTVQDALKHPELFPSPDDPAKGAVHNCPSSWNCRFSTANLYKALEGDKAGFQLVDPGSAAGLDGSIAEAFEKKTGWLGYYWAPTAVLGKYEMTLLSFGVDHDKAEWDSCTAVPDCPAPKVNSYPVSDVYTVVTGSFADRAGSAMNYVGARQWENATINKVLAWMDQNQATNEDAARYFLGNFQEIWTQWVSPEVAEKVKAAL